MTSGHGQVTVGHGQVTVFFDFLCTLLICFVLLSGPTGSPQRRSAEGGGRGSVFSLTNVDPLCDGITLGANLVGPDETLIAFDEASDSGAIYAQAADIQISAQGLRDIRAVQLFLRGRADKDDALDCLSTSYTVEYSINGTTRGSQVLVPEENHIAEVVIVS